MRILLVDDNQDILYIFKKGLEDKGFVVDTFTNPKDALEYFKPNYYDLIITDIRMPGMSGFELCIEIKKRDENAKIYFLTAFDMNENELRETFPNISENNAFISKPISIENLAKKIENMNR
jgi:CheY-like chemotaxis protein